MPQASKIWTLSQLHTTTTYNFELFWQKGINNFWQSLNAILEEFPVVKTIVDAKLLIRKTSIIRCSKKYGSPTRVPRLKVAVNMTDPNSLMKNPSYPNTFFYYISQSETKYYHKSFKSWLAWHGCLLICEKKMATKTFRLNIFLKLNILKL